MLTEWLLRRWLASRLVNLPAETLDLLRFGRGVDNRKLKEAGFTYRFTTAGAVQ